MKVITPFDPSATPTPLDPGLVNPCGVLYLVNESNIGIQLTFPDGSTGVLPPWFARAWQLKHPGAVTWTAIYNLASSQPPISQVFGEGYEPSEVTFAHLSQGPVMRQANIGNTVSTGVQVPTNVNNDGNVANTVFLEATQAGASNSNFSADNSGNLTVAQFVATVRTILFQVIAGATTVIKAGAVGKLVEILGDILVDGASTFTGAMTVNNTVTAQSFIPTAQPGYQFLNTSINGSAIAAISRLARFSGNGNATITHNFASNADFVFVQYTGNITPPTAVPCWRNISNTQVGINAAAQNWTAIVCTN